VAVLVVLRWVPLWLQLPLAVVGILSLILSIIAWFRKRIQQIGKWRGKP
jgi:hypothetical protein